MRNGNYELVLAPEDYPGRKYRGRYCYEHRLVVWQKTGQLPDDLVIHHINENKRDNRISNLQVLTREEHTHLHTFGNGNLVHGTLNAYSHYNCRCDECKEKWNTYNKANKKQRRLYSDLAQRQQQLPVKETVGGSIPSVRAKVY